MIHITEQDKEQIIKDIESLMFHVSIDHQEALSIALCSLTGKVVLVSRQQKCDRCKNIISSIEYNGEFLCHNCIIKEEQGEDGNN